MMNTGKLAGKTIFITGGSRGIGKAIALKAAKDGANIIIAAKTAEPHPKLPGTIYTAAKEIEAAGGKALPCVVDVRNEEQIKTAVESGVKKFGGIDILVNNASAISLTGTLETDMKRYDLMHHINTRGTFLVSKICLPHLKKGKNSHILNLSPPLNLNPLWFKQHVAYTMAKYGMSMCVLGMSEEFKSEGIAVNALWPRTSRMSKVCLPYLKKGKNPHILNLSPPLNLNPLWFKVHVAYTMAKYGMSMCVLGMSEEFKDDGIAVNALWPRTAIQTAAIEMLMGDAAEEGSRKPEIMADAAYAILCRDSRSVTGQFFIDDEVLLEEGLTEKQIDAYASVPGNKELTPDFFLDLDADGKLLKAGYKKLDQARKMSTHAGRSKL